MAAARSGYRRYAPVWSVVRLRWVFAGTLIARLAQTMIPLTLLLLFNQRMGGFAPAGLAVAMFGSTFAVASPLTARLADRHGAEVLIGAGSISTASLILLAVIPSLVWSWVTVVLAGASMPPLTATLRTEIVARLVTEPERTAAFSLDAVATELLFVAGPTAVAATLIFGRPAVAIVAAAAMILAGSTVVAIAADRSDDRAGHPPTTSALSRRWGLGQAAGLLPWLTIAVAQMASIGFVEVAVTARTVRLGQPASPGTVLAVWAAGSAIGGLVYGSRDWPGPVSRQLRVLLLLTATGFSVAALAQDMTWLYPLMFLAGLATAPAAAALTTSFSTAMDDVTRGQSFALLASCGSLAASAGYAAAGLLLAHFTITATILVGAALPLAAAAAVPQRRSCQLNLGASDAE